MAIADQRKGELYIFSQAVMWGIFPVITVLTYSLLSPLVSLGLTTLFSAAFFAILVTLKGEWHNVLNREALPDILGTTFFLGILFYVFFFLGLKYTSPGNASIIALTEILFSYLFFHIWRKDQIPGSHIAGAALMLAGAVIVLFPGFTSFRAGDILVLSAAFVAPFGNFFQQRARRLVSSEVILFVRSLLSAVAVLLFAYFFGHQNIFGGIQDSLWFLLLNGIFLLGLSKIFWIEGIHRISVTKANALSSVSPFLTLLFAWVILRELPTVWQLASIVPMFFGTILLSRNERLN